MSSDLHQTARGQDSNAATRGAFERSCPRPIAGRRKAAAGMTGEDLVRVLRHAASGLGPAEDTEGGKQSCRAGMRQIRGPCRDQPRLRPSRRIRNHSSP